MRTLVLCFVMAPFFVCFAYAQDIYAIAGESFELDAMEQGLSEEELQISGDIKSVQGFDVTAAMSRLWSSFVDAIISELKESYTDGVKLLGIIFLSGFAGCFCKDKEILSFAEIICCEAAAVMLLTGLDGIVSQTVNAMYRLSDYSKAALPVVFSAAAAGGAVSSAATKFTAVSLALDVLMSISQKIIIPMIYAFIAMCLAGSVFPNPMLSGVQKICKWAAGTMMSGMTIAFTSYIAFVGAIGSAVDASAVKTAKTVISNILPVVGGVVSDASALILSAAGVVRNCAGVFGLVAVAIMCAGPFAFLSVKMLVLKAAALLADAMQSERLFKLLSGISGAMALLLGLLGCCGLMLFISLTAGMRVISGI